MCTTSLYNPPLQIAKEDIEVYKYVNIIRGNFLFGLFRPIKYFKSIIEEFKYKPNKVYTTTLSPFIYFPTFNDYRSSKGFYSYKRYSKYKVNVKCIIPKGSCYYLCRDTGDSEEIYHSDKIKIVSTI